MWMIKKQCIVILIVSLQDRLGFTVIYSNKKETSDFYGTVSFDSVKIAQQNLNQNVHQTSDTQKLVII